MKAMKHTTVRITKEFHFEMAHALVGYDGACRNIHGHSYKFSVTVKGVPNPNPNEAKWGMVIDFKDLNRIIKEKVVDIFDHSVVLQSDTPQAALQEMKKIYSNIIVKSYQPTCENLLIDFVDAVDGELPPNVTLHAARLDETATSYAEWHADDNR
jgi:6-pyruvoyltetrahydropterin/6-carboxytetrahydropterin synthase